MKFTAEAAGLLYVSDLTPGISRKLHRRKFRYFYPDGRRVRDKATLGRIKHLAIPPAYQNVWICHNPLGHIQATGRDDRGRKQYRYHEKWREVRDADKYDRMLEFGEALPKIRKITSEHLNFKGLPKEKVLASVVQLLEKTLIRVGNEEYAKQNNSFGLTTMRVKHVDVHGSKIHFEFKGKSKIYHSIDIEDRRLAKIVKNCQDLPGYELFQYLDENGERHKISSEDVNDYLRIITGQPFTAKDFRTWSGTVLAALALSEYQTFSSDRECKRNITQAIESVAKRLGNTKAICRKCYVHPAVLNAYKDGEMLKLAQKETERELKKESSSLRPEERSLMKLLEKRLKVERLKKEAPLKRAS